jgi:hypothetical protein
MEELESLLEQKDRLIAKIAKLEAENERLQQKLKRALEIGRWFRKNVMSGQENDEGDFFERQVERLSKEIKALEG